MRKEKDAKFAALEDEFEKYRQVSTQKIVTQETSIRTQTTRVLLLETNVTSLTG
jgi:hypothetical protein